MIVKLPAYSRLMICALAALVSGCVKPSQAQPGNRMTTSAVISYSIAPWDGAAYQLLIPLSKSSEASNPFIKIDIWGNPSFHQPETLALSTRNNSKERGRAIYQPVLNESLPEVLTGTVYLESLKQGLPVSGTFNLSSSDGRTFVGRFQARWGNDRPVDTR